MRAVVLLSGGIDSAVCLELALRENREVIALTFDYRQRNRREIECARVQAEEAEVMFVLSNLDLPAARAYPELELDRPVNEIGAKGDRPVSYVPARNTIFLAHALSLAEHNGAREIWIGANAGDRAGYPDCRDMFFKSFLLTAAMGTRVEDLEIRHPLLEKTKPQVVDLARELGVDIWTTSSCYFGMDCGRCDACVLRNHALGIQ